MLAYKHCRESSLVNSVVLKDLGKSREHLSDDEVIWEIAADAGSPLARFELGATPEEFEQRVPLRTSLSGKLLNVQIKSTDLPHGESMTFELSQLRAGELLVGEGYMAADEFRKASACD
ncbi:MAG: hypothetical protein IT303_09125 [Dehalococcoidia bacterium]|nr:hypothetical protein [Dehalococcoidia bacterium]